MTKGGWKVLFKGNSCTISHKESTIKINKSHDLYPIKGCIAKRSELSIDEWHRRLGHLNEADIKRMARHEMVRGLDQEVANQTLSECRVCLANKSTRLPFPRKE